MRSAAVADDFPRDHAAEIALVGRSNVGKSTLINALVRGRVARTSAAPGKTRLANIYRVVRGSAAPFYFVDLPGYGYARGPASELEAVTRAFFEREGPEAHPVSPVRRIAALLLVDARRPARRVTSRPGGGCERRPTARLWWRPRPISSRAANGYAR